MSELVEQSLVDKEGDDGEGDGLVEVQHPAPVQSCHSFLLVDQLTRPPQLSVPGNREIIKSGTDYTPRIIRI